MRVGFTYPMLDRPNSNHHGVERLSLLYCDAPGAVTAEATAGDGEDAAAFCSSYSRLPLIALNKNVAITISTMTMMSAATRVVGLDLFGLRGSFMVRACGRPAARGEQKVVRQDPAFYARRTRIT